jgi:hypothetical protein
MKKRKHEIEKKAGLKTGLYVRSIVYDVLFLYFRGFVLSWPVWM